MWRRDPTRVQQLVTAAVFGVVVCLLPLSFGEHRPLAFAAPLYVQTLALTCANLIGYDGTALWATLVTPGAAAAEVRGRQRSWLAVGVPLAVAIALATTSFAPQSHAWATTIALTAVLLGGGAGLIVAVGTVMLVPGPDPHQQASALDHGDTTGQALVTFFATVLIAAPTAGLLAVGAATQSTAIAWSAVGVGLATGAAAMWLGGRFATDHLDRRGAELLQRMRAAGPTASPKASERQPQAGHSLWFTVTAFGGLIALFPQALVPAAIKLSGGTARVWFLALHLPETWQWPCIAAMVGIGVTSLAAARHLMATEHDSST